MKTPTLLGLALLACGVAIAMQQAQPAHPILGQAIPEFSATATDGKTYTHDGFAKGAPTFVVFWKNPCPHNPRASSLINSIVAAYKGKVTFLGVVNSDGDAAKKFQEQFGKEYAFLHDPAKAVIGGFKMKQSLTFVQINKDKKVEAVYGGYGQASLAELNTAMAKAAGMEEAKIDLSGAPARTTYG